MEKIIDVDLYIKNASPESQPILKELRELIKSTIPEATEEIGWNVPIYKYHGVLAGFDTYENHGFVSFGIDVIDDTARKSLEDAGYKTENTTIQLKFDQKVPVSVIKKLLQTQAELNKAKSTK